MRGDWECPLIAIVYFDGTHLRGYVPTDGNIFIKTTKQAFGTAEEADAIAFLRAQYGSHPSVAGQDDAQLQSLIEEGGVAALMFDADVLRADIAGRIQAKGTHTITETTLQKMAPKAAPAPKRAPKTAAPATAAPQPIPAPMAAAPMERAFGAFVDQNTRQAMIDIRIKGVLMSMAEYHQQRTSIPVDLVPHMHPVCLGALVFTHPEHPGNGLFVYMHNLGYAQEGHLSSIAHTPDNSVARRIWATLTKPRPVWMLNTTAAQPNQPTDGCTGAPSP